MTVFFVSPYRIRAISANILLRVFELLHKLIVRSELRRESDLRGCLSSLLAISLCSGSKSSQVTNGIGNNSLQKSSLQTTSKWK